MKRHPLVAQLQEIRQQLGLTQTELAQRVHKRPQAVAHFENAPGDRQLRTVEDVASVLGYRLALVPIEEEQ